MDLPTAHVYSSSVSLFRKHFSETGAEKVDHVAMIHGLPHLRVSKAVCAFALDQCMPIPARLSRCRSNYIHITGPADVQEAEKIAEQDKQSLLAQRKLALILDLDQTLIHATTALYVEGWMDDPSNRPEVHTPYLPTLSMLLLSACTAHIESLMVVLALSALITIRFCIAIS